jgi:pyruvate,water dikinase
MYIINLDSVDGQTPGVGGKANSLGMLARAGFMIPKGFVVTTEAFEKFLTDTGIGLLLPQILEGVNPDEPGTAFQASKKVGELFAKCSGTDFLIRELREAYSELSFGKDVNTAGGLALSLIRAGRGDSFVSVRPSVACPREQVSFAGHGKAVLNQLGHRQILGAVKECWLSVFSPEAILYRKLRGAGDFSLAVMVQKMVDSELSGNLFTSEPVSGDKSILVEAWWGLGETLCCGCVSPDQYLLSKEGALVSKKTWKKLWLRRRGPLSGQTIQERVPASRVSMDTLSERDFPKFAAIAKRAEEVFRTPQEMEWCVERGRIVIMQSRPAVLSKAQAASEERPDRIFQGLGVSAGTAMGKARVINDMSAMRKPEQPAVLVTRNLGVEILPYARWFSGIVSEQGGAGSCMASLGRELGIPIVAGVQNAAAILDGMNIALDGMSGSICAATR